MEHNSTVVAAMKSTACEDIVMLYVAGTLQFAGDASLTVNSKDHKRRVQLMC
jgi:hypothetical protein